ncbi:MAG: DUF1127 domain-containing protein [Aestuariivirga sp.]|nr:DUF1127 domain-containing protein [Aestuariivirga sp.]
MNTSNEVLGNQSVAKHESPVAGALQWIIRQIEIHRARRHLEALPDRLLRDIGIHRAMIHSAARHGISRTENTVI